MVTMPMHQWLFTHDGCGQSLAGRPDLNTNDAPITPANIIMLADRNSHQPKR